MFDCPEQSQTSPMSTSSRTTWLLPLMVSLNGPPAGSAGSLAIHLPSAPGVAVTAGLSPNCTLTGSPGSAQPHTGMAMSRCSTMWLPKMCATFTSA